MVLNNVILLPGERKVNISVKGATIGIVSTDTIVLEKDEPELNFNNAVALPGLINSHDHLDFNCFTSLGTRTYRNYTEWGKHIHETYKADIDEVMKIPEQLRVQWGIYKNLLAGVTTVVNHGKSLKIDKPLISVIQDTQNLHSVKFQKNWKLKLNNPFLRNKECVIHTGEGADEQSYKEIDELLNWNLLKRNLVGIHAVAMKPAQAKKFEAIVWCPESNRFLLNKDADVMQLKKETRMVFGTDSTLTGDWNIWKHLRLARSTGFVTDAELFDMVTASPAMLWKRNTGLIMPGKEADIIIARKGTRPGNSFFETEPEDILLLVHQGQIRLFDKELLEQIKMDISGFSTVTINGVVKFVEGNLAELITTIKNYYPKAIFPVDAYVKAAPIVSR